MDISKTEFWKAKLTRLYPLLEKSVKRRFQNDSEKASDALAFVSEKLVEDNMRRLSLYNSSLGATFETYFSVLVQRLISKFIENSRKRRRFPKWLERQGNDLWHLVYRLLCWELKSETDVVDYLESTAPGKRDEHIVWEAVWVIRENFPNCGKNQVLEVVTDQTDFDSGDGLNCNPAFHHISPEEQMAFSQLMSLADAIFTEPHRDDSIEEAVTGELSDIKNRLRLKFNPSHEKRLFLKMIYQDGMSVSSAGRMLGWTTHQASGHHRRLMDQLKDILGDDFLI
ncbi:MAG: hypothetical protein KKD44_00185 [Proteobacteria bacterium]|nr:hypothetical protein [Pseudomonadota bacterium]